MAATQPVYVLGVGLTKFIKPRDKVGYPELGFEAGVKALLDAGITYDDVNFGVACYVYGDSTCGQRVFYQFGTESSFPSSPLPYSTFLYARRQLILAATRHDANPHLQPE